MKGSKGKVKEKKGQGSKRGKKEVKDRGDDNDERKEWQEEKFKTNGEEGKTIFLTFLFILLSYHTL